MTRSGPPGVEARRLEGRRSDARRSFDAALARAREGRGARSAGEGVARRDPGGRTPAGERPGGLRPSASPEEPAPASPGTATGPGASVNPDCRHGSGPALPELREAARAIPPAIWAGRLGGAAAVELSFGRELSVELRAGSAGIEIVVRTDAALARAARADLPALLRLLGARGVAVARAEVRAQPHGAAQPMPPSR